MLLEHWVHLLVQSKDTMMVESREYKLERWTVRKLEEGWAKTKVVKWAAMTVEAKVIQWAAMKVEAKAIKWVAMRVVSKES